VVEVGAGFPQPNPNASVSQALHHTEYGRDILAFVDDPHVENAHGIGRHASRLPKSLDLSYG
jgi:hypothetical protein